MEVAAIYTSLAKVMDGVGSIGKDKQGHGYKFRGIDDVMNTFGPLFTQNKILVTKDDLFVKREVRKVEKTKYNTNGQPEKIVKDYIESELSAKYRFTSLLDGSYVTALGYGEGQDSSGGDKSSAMAQSNSYKYVMFEMFNIPTEDQIDSDQFTANQENAKTAESVGNAKEAAKKKIEESKPAPTDVQYAAIKLAMGSTDFEKAMTKAKKYQFTPEQSAELNKIYKRSKGKAVVAAAESKAK